MKKSKRFQPVVRVAEAREKQAASALGDAQADLQSRIARLEELQHYREEYQQRFAQSGSQGLAAYQLLDYRRFLDNLKLAIDQQETFVSLAKRAVEERKQAWFSRRGKLKTFGNVLEQYHSEEIHAENKREQNEIDERAQILSCHKKKRL